LSLIVILGRGVSNAILAIGVVYLTTTSRITYGLALRLRTETYVEAANSMGAGAVWTIRKHILPNLISPLLVQASFVFAFAQLSAASLDFLGLGEEPRPVRLLLGGRQRVRLRLRKSGHPFRRLPSATLRRSRAALALRAARLAFGRLHVRCSQNSIPRELPLHRSLR